MIRLVFLRLLENYFQHRWLYLLPVLIMFIAGVAYPFVVPASYVAEGTVYVQPETLLSSLTVVWNDGFAFRYVTPA